MDTEKLAESATIVATEAGKKQTVGAMLKDGLLGAVGLIVLTFVVFGVVALFIGNGTGDTSGGQATLTEHIRSDIAVSFVNVKEVDGKHRWFYGIKNNGATPFSGEVTIYLVNGLGESVYDDTFTATSPIQPGISKSVYIDTYTGPASVHGENGISSFKFEAKD